MPAAMIARLTVLLGAASCALASQPKSAADLPDPVLDPAQAMHLFRIGREAITNALRHAAPHRLRFKALK